MTNPVQFLLVIVVTTLTTLVSVVAVQVWQILAEARQVMKKINKILDNAQTLSDVKELVEEPKHHYFRRSGLPLRPS